MDREQEIDKLTHPDRRIQYTFSILPLFRIFQNYVDFGNYVKKKSALTRSVYRGYRFLITQLIVRFIHTLQDDEFLDLYEDKKTRRAFFVGLDYELIPSSSEKANLVKNLFKIADDVEHCKNAEQLVGFLDYLQQSFMSQLSLIFHANVQVAQKVESKFDKYKLLDYCAAFFLWNASYEMNRMVPLNEEAFDIVSPQGTSRISNLRKGYDYDFEGYKLGLAYLWRELHLDWATSHIECLCEARDWEELMKAIDDMRSILFDIEKAIGQSLILPHLFSKKGKVHKNQLKALTSSSLRCQLTLNQKIDDVLLWYQFDIIDSASSKIFSGGATFTSLLQGEVMERSNQGVGEKLETVRFTHPGAPVTFSYAILIERFGGIADFSGWLIFLDVGGDYPGRGGTEYDTVEQRMFELHEHLNVTEFRVDQRDLADYYIHKIKERKANFGSLTTDSEDVRFRLDEDSKRLAKALGRLLEFLAKTYFEERKFKTKIRLRDRKLLTNNSEVDVVAWNSYTKEAFIVECSKSIHISNIGKFVIEIDKKCDLLRKSPNLGGYVVHKVFLTTAQTVQQINSDSNVKALFESSGIERWSVERDLIPSLPRRFKKDELLSIFAHQDEDSFAIRE